MRRSCSICCLLVLLLSTSDRLPGAEDSLQHQARQTLRQASAFFRDKVSSEGGYLYRYSSDLSKREGEGRGDDRTVWVQPPGTPSVGLALLQAYHATGDDYYLNLARDAGECLLRGQLHSGGWSYSIEFTPDRRRRHAYRVEGPESAGQRNTTTLDDNTTQAALRLLMELDKAFDFKDEQIHEATSYALSSLIRAQYKNGAWPQRFEAPPDDSQLTVRRASYPESWPRQHPDTNYREYFTFNDNAIADVIDVMFIAHWTYGKERYLEAAKKGGEFILLAQMPDPQPAWAQQYDLAMQPSWARRFEPPAVTGGESQGVMRTLLRLYRDTGESRFLEPVPRAIKYLDRSQLQDGRLARFYELKTNRPLYFTRQYELTYDDSDLPTHYSFKSSNGLAGIQREYDRLKSLPTEKLGQPPTPAQTRTSRSLENLVRRVIASLDDKGRWVEQGNLRNYENESPEPVIESRTFIQNVDVLSRYLAAVRN